MLQLVAGSKHNQSKPPSLKTTCPTVRMGCTSSVAGTPQVLPGTTTLDPSRTSTCSDVSLGPTGGSPGRPGGKWSTWRNCRSGRGHTGTDRPCLGVAQPFPPSVLRPAVVHLLRMDDLDWTSEEGLGSGSRGSAGVAFKIKLRGVPVCIKVGRCRCDNLFRSKNYEMTSSLTATSLHVLHAARSSTPFWTWTIQLTFGESAVAVRSTKVSWRR